MACAAGRARGGDGELRCARFAGRNSRLLLRPAPKPETACSFNPALILWRLQFLPLAAAVDCARSPRAG
ncbi:MAG TPA: hypothetical protein DC058_16355 [Planctomycetaceae bacterium]|nr:hypothetical protein [Planctomycetaceae bacterium]HBC62773.1 hypothetical protein [Planctomycetaceae bacterium]